MTVATENLRSRTYALLGNLLAIPPYSEMLGRLAEIDAGSGNGDALAGAWAKLSAAARQACPAELEDEFHALFIGLGRGELMPYGSWYRTGFLHERPLAELRADLEALGIERCEDMREPEDHAAALCQSMALLADASAGFDFRRQRQFFVAHMDAWIHRFFRDLETSRGARFYRAVAALGLAFIEFERLFLATTDNSGPALNEEDRIHERV